MELSFLDKNIRKICEDDEYAINELGPEVARDLQNRLADLSTASDIYELSAGGFTMESAPPFLEYRIALTCGFWLFIHPNHTKTPLADENIDWSKVRRIKILKIEKQ